MKEKILSPIIADGSPCGGILDKNVIVFSIHRKAQFPSDFMFRFSESGSDDFFNDNFPKANQEGMIHHALVFHTFFDQNQTSRVIQCDIRRMPLVFWEGYL